LGSLFEVLQPPPEISWSLNRFRKTMPSALLSLPRTPSSAGSENVPEITAPRTSKTEKIRNVKEKNCLGNRCDRVI